MRFILLVILFVFLSFELIIAKSDYRIVKPVINNIDNKTTIKFDKHELYSFCDSNISKRLLCSDELKTENKNKFIDSTDCSPYKSRIIIFKSKVFSDYIIIWSVEGEYSSDINLYYIIKDKLFKICNLPIQTVCEKCDDWNFPIDKIIIHGDKNKIVISVQQPISYRINDKDWQVYQPNKFVLKFDKTIKNMNNWQ